MFWWGVEGIVGDTVSVSLTSSASFPDISSSWELFLNRILSSGFYSSLSAQQSACSPCVLLLLSSGPFSGSQSVLSLHLPSFFFIPQAPLLLSLFPEGLVLSLRAASCMLLGLSKESIEIAAKTSCLSSDCSTQIWHWAVIAEKDLLRPLEHVQCRQKGWEIQVQEVLAVHRPQGLKLDIFEWLFIERAKGTRSLPTCKSLF